jgi:hypothetical protein
MVERICAPELGINREGTDYYDPTVWLGRGAITGMGAHEFSRYCQAKGLPSNYSNLARPVVANAWPSFPEAALAEVIPIFRASAQEPEAGLATAV